MTICVTGDRVDFVKIYVSDAHPTNEWAVYTKVLYHFKYRIHHFKYRIHDFKYRIHDLNTNR